ncbi:MAG: hypothetical protein Kow0037_20290 [Calditrichia bacterium]
MRYLFYSLLSGLVFLAISCSNPFAPRLADENTPHSRLLTAQETPQEVLTNFRYAYTYKDSLVYAEVLDSTFFFRSFDYNQSPPQPLEWGRDTELRTTGRMFRYFNTMDVVWNSISLPDTVEREPELRIEHRVTFTLTLDGGRVIPPLNGEVLFQFIRRNKKYYISLWKDQKI